MPIGTVVAVASTLISVIKGIRDISQSRKYARETRPNYAIPDEVYDNLHMAQLRAAMREIPGADILEGKLGASVSETLKNLQEVVDNPSAALGALAGLEAKKQDTLANLELMNKDWWEKNQERLMEANSYVANWKDRKADWEQRQPYLNSMQTAAAFEKSGTEELGGAVKNILGYFSYKDFWDSKKKEAAGESSGTPQTMPLVDTGQKLAKTALNKEVANYDFTPTGLNTVTGRPSGIPLRFDDTYNPNYWSGKNFDLMPKRENYFWEASL